MLEKYNKKTIMLAHEGCKGCKTMKNTLNEEIERNFITVVDVEKAEGKELVSVLKDQVGLSYVPTLLSIEQIQGSRYKVCSVERGTCTEVVDKSLSTDNVECKTCNAAVGLGWGFSMAKELGMSNNEIQKLRNQAMNEEVDPDQILDNIINLAKSKGKKDYEESLVELKRMMKTPLSELKKEIKGK